VQRCGFYWEKEEKTGGGRLFPDPDQEKPRIVVNGRLRRSLLSSVPRTLLT
jgi:hypothetical protein